MRTNQNTLFTLFGVRPYTSDKGQNRKETADRVDLQQRLHENQLDSEIQDKLQLLFSPPYAVTMDHRSTVALKEQICPTCLRKINSQIGEELKPLILMFMNECNGKHISQSHRLAEVAPLAYHQWRRVKHIYVMVDKQEQHQMEK